MTPLLELKNIVKRFPRDSRKAATGYLFAVDDVNLRIEAGETVGLMGESGAGKSTLARIAAGLLPPDHGQVMVDEQDIGTFSENQLKRNVWTRLQMVFQNVSGAFDPRFTMAETLRESLRFSGLKPADYHSRSVELLREVDLGEMYLNRYPHELSTGEKQRISLSRTLAVSPELIILDEPVTALDITAAGKVLDLLARLKKRHRLSYLVVTHDLGVLAFIADRIGAMIDGRIVEIGSRETILKSPVHPYTRYLVQVSRVLGDALARGSRPAEMNGDTPDCLTNKPGYVPGTSGGNGACSYAGSCPRSRSACWHERPVLTAVKPGHLVACHLLETRE
ncbi:MAG: ABC transporter ATP-binding protein [Gemmatimonadota bacterium]|nr:ABC transporter ATP-binding protein [Gemmatimonadota bacterium]